MILFSVLAFFVLGTLINAPLNAQDIYPVRNAAQPKDESVVSSGVVTLDNGLKAIVREDHRNPIVVFSVFVDSGSASEAEYTGSGISHLVEHMLFKGTKKYPVGAIEDILNRYGGNIEGYTSYDYTGYSVTILKDHLEVAMDVLKEMLTAPMFDSGELIKEKAVIEREMDLNKDNPDKRLSRITFETAFLKHPYRIPPIGYKENFERLTRDDLVKFFKAAYLPEKMTIAVVGDVDTQDVLAKLKEYFGSIKRGRNTFFAKPVEPLQITERFLEESSDIGGAYMNISFHSTDLLNKDLYAMDILSFILGQGESSILNEKLRMAERITLSIYAYNYTPKDPGLFVISSVLKEENVNKVITAVIGEIENLKENLIGEEELNKAKNNFIAEYVFQKETIEAQANDMAQSQILTGSPDFFKQYVENVKAVKPEDIKQAASKYLNRQNMTVTVLSKSGNALKIKEAGDLEKITGETKKILLSNRIPVIISENHSLPIIAVSILMKAGVRVENENTNGISMIVSRMLMDGTNQISRQALAKFYESRAIALDTYSGNNSMGITMTCLKEHIEDALMLEADMLLNSSFPEQEFKREISEILQAIEMQDNDIVTQGHRLLKEMLFKIHPYRFQAIGSKESINKITLGAVKDLYKNILRAENIAIGVSGDFKTGEMMELLEKYFSKITLNKISLPKAQKEPAIEKIIENTVKIYKDQSLILIGFRGIDMYDKNRYEVEILNNILSSPSGVLFKSIREEKGLTYSVGAFNVLGIDPGYMVIYALTSKENIQKVRQRIFRELAALSKDGLTEDPIKKSKNYLKAMRKVSMQANSSFISSVAMDELYGLGYEDYKSFDKKMDAVKLEDVKSAAKRILTPDKCAVLILQGK